MKRQVVVCDGCGEIHEQPGAPLPFTESFHEGWGAVTAPRAVLYPAKTVDYTAEPRRDDRHVDLCGRCLVTMRAWWVELAERV